LRFTLQGAWFAKKVQKIDTASASSFFNKTFCEYPASLSAACRKGYFIAAPAFLAAKVLRRVDVIVTEPGKSLDVLNPYDGTDCGMTAKIGIVVHPRLFVALHARLLLISGIYSFP